jgi:hypothetical protein
MLQVKVIIKMFEYNLNPVQYSSNKINFVCHLHST